MAVPLAGWLASRWLEDFAFRIDLNPWYYLLAGLGVLVITLLTVGTQAWQAAQAHPADAFREE